MTKKGGADAKSTRKSNSKQKVVNPTHIVDSFGNTARDVMKKSTRKSSAPKSSSKSATKKTSARKSPSKTSASKSATKKGETMMSPLSRLHSRVGLRRERKIKLETEMSKLSWRREWQMRVAEWETEWASWTRLRQTFQIAFQDMKLNAGDVSRWDALQHAVKMIDRWLHHEAPQERIELFRRHLRLIDDWDTQTQLLNAAFQALKTNRPLSWWRRVLKAFQHIAKVAWRWGNAVVPPGDSREALINGLDQVFAIVQTMSQTLDAMNVSFQESRMQLEKQVRAELEHKYHLNLLKTTHAIGEEHEKLIKEAQLLQQTIRAITQTMKEKARGLVLDKKVIVKHVRQDMARYLLEEYRQWELQAVVANADTKSLCDETNDPRKLELTPMQRLVPAILDPAKSLAPLGVLVGYQMGVGKTPLAVATCKLFCLHSQGREPILFLVPHGNLITNAMKEFQRWCLPEEWSFQAKMRRESSQGSNDDEEINGGGKHTSIATLTHIADKKSLTIVFHTMTVALPVSAARKFSIKRHEFVLPQWKDVKNDSIYINFRKTLSDNDEKSLLQKDKLVREAILKKDNIALPDHGLVIVDESHNLADPSTLIKISTESITVMAWANALRASYERTCKLQMTASFFESERPTITTKLLNNLKPVSEAATMQFEGCWRPAIPVQPTNDTDRRLKPIYARMSDVERDAMEAAFQKNKTKWRATMAASYGGLLFYATLDYDPTVFPQYQKCSNCVFVWDEKRGLEQVSTLSQQDKNKLVLQTVPPTWNERLVYVPLSTDQEKKFRDAVKADLKEFPGHTAKTLNYGLDPKKLKSSVLASFGTKFSEEKGKFKSNPKWNAALSIVDAELSQAQQPIKFFIFESAVDPLLVSKGSNYLEKRGWQVWRMSKIFSTYVHSKSGKGDVKAIVDEIYRSLAQQQQNKPMRRALWFMELKTNLGKWEAGAEVVKQVLLGIWNDPRNAHGEYFQILVGDRNTKEGISALNTMQMISMAEPSDDTLRLQSRARNRRYCSLRGYSFDQWDKMKLWQLVSISHNWRSATADTKTNEEYQLHKRAQVKTASSMQDGWIAITGDCFLFQRYNHVPSCWQPGEVLLDGEEENDEDQPGLRRTLRRALPMDIVCVQTASLRFVSARSLVEVVMTPNGVETTASENMDRMLPVAGAKPDEWIAAKPLYPSSSNSHPQHAAYLDTSQTSWEDWKQTCSQILELLPPNIVDAMWVGVLATELNKRDKIHSNKNDNSADTLDVAVLYQTLLPSLMRVLPDDQQVPSLEMWGEMVQTWSKLTLETALMIVKTRAEREAVVMDAAQKFLDYAALARTRRVLVKQLSALADES